VFGGNEVCLESEEISQNLLQKNRSGEILQKEEGGVGEGEEKKEEEFAKVKRNLHVEKDMYEDDLQRQLDAMMESIDLLKRVKAKHELRALESQKAAAGFSRDHPDLEQREEDVARRIDEEQEILILDVHLENELQRERRGLAREKEAQEEIERLETCLRAEERKHKRASSGGHAVTKLLREVQAKILLLYEKKGALKGQLLLQPHSDDVQNLRRQQSNLLEHQHRIIKHTEAEMAMHVQSSLQDIDAKRRELADVEHFLEVSAEAQALESENTLLEQAEPKAELLREQERLVALELELTLLEQKAELLREQERLVALEFQLIERQDGSATDS
jgi:hypothetical protein